MLVFRPQMIMMLVTLALGSPF